MGSKYKLHWFKHFLICTVGMLFFVWKNYFVNFLLFYLRLLEVMKKA